MRRDTIFRLPDPIFWPKDTGYLSARTETIFWLGLGYLLANRKEIIPGSAAIAQD
jgi:hypothetical protein